MTIVPWIKTLLSSPKPIVITMHTQPDADALGASLGLARFLEKSGHQVHVIAPTTFPDFLDWLPGRADVIVYHKTNHEPIAHLIADAAIIFCVDFALLSRIPEIKDLIAESAAKKIVIDHHIDPVDFTEYAFCDTKATASAELVYELMEKLDQKEVLDRDIAECLYAGILTDTNAFKTPNTTPRVHRIVAELMEQQVDIAKINKLIYDNNSLNKLKFLSFALDQCLVFRPECRTAYFVIKNSDAKQFNLGAGDTEGLVNYALSLKGIVLAALIKERKDRVSLSFRSVGDFSVNHLAKAYFEGGGHKNAAGGVSRLPLAETISKFEDMIQSEQNALQNSRMSYEK